MQIVKRLLTLLSLTLAVMPLAKGADGTYMRASASYIVPEADDSEEVIGGMLALGSAMDIRFSDNRNLFEFETGWAEWDYTQRAVLGGADYSGITQLTFIPALLTYRYEIAVTDYVKFAIGPSAGFTYFRGSGDVTDGVSTAHVSDSDIVFTYGAGAQIKLTLSDTVSLNLGYRYLFNEQAEFQIAGQNTPLGDLDVHLFEVGLRFEWPY